MKISRFAFGRLLKLLGNIAKAVFLVLDLIAPRLRFEIPECSPPLKRGSSTTIPSIVWQTNFTRRVTAAVYANFLFNRMMAASFEFRLLDDASMQEAIRAFDERTRGNFAKLNIGAAKADFWRVLTIHAQGGVYLDMDAGLIWPLASTLKDHKEYYVAYKDGRITNYFFASVSGTQSLKRAIAIINQNIEDNSERSVWTMTGPGVFEKAIGVRPHRREESCIQGLLTSEYFQYLDRPAKKWTQEEKTTPIVNIEGA